MPILIVMNAIAHASNLPRTGPKLDSRRTLAALLDLVIVAAGAAAILFASGVLPDGSASDLTPALDALVLGWALYYYFACESTGGQTIGKKLFKLRVLCVDGSPVGVREVAVRTVLRVVDGIGLYLVGLIVMLVTGQRRARFGDLAAGTIIADASRTVAPASPEPAAEPGPEAPNATITLPARPEPAMAAAAAPAVPEMRPFEPGVAEADVPVVEEPVAALAEPEPVVELAEPEPVVEVAEPEPVAELADPEPVAEPEPVVELAEPEPVVELSEPGPVVDVAEPEPVVEVPEPVVPVEPVVVDEPAAGVPAVQPEDVASPSLKELARDVAEAVSAPAEEDAPAEDSADPDEPVTVKSVETVSAIDLVMGAEDTADEHGTDS